MATTPTPVWTAQQKIDGIGTSFRPALVTFNGLVYAFWKGVHSDTSIYYSSTDAIPDPKTGKLTWAPQTAIHGIGSALGPDVTVWNNKIYLAWQGVPGDDAWYFNSFDGHSFSAQSQVFGTSFIPSLEPFNNDLWAAWKGVGSDQNIYYSAWGGGAKQPWSPQLKIPNVGTSTGPFLAAYQGRLWAFWKGVMSSNGTLDDNTTYYSTFDGRSWQPQTIMPVASSTIGVAVCVSPTHLYFAWRGREDDDAIHSMRFNGRHWDEGTTIAGAGSSAGPTIAWINNKVIAAWAGVPGDDAIYCSWWPDNP